MRCGLLGRKLGHSYSPQIHGHLGNYSYELFERSESELEAFLKNEDFRGLNVTIPYKKDVIPYLDLLSKEASELGAVNTIVRSSDGSLVGHNTDYYGFKAMFERTGINPKGKKVLVLGSGGASATVVAILKEKNAAVVVISRSGNNNYENLHRHADAAVIVNTTPVGMYPNTGCSPIDLALFPQLEGVLDLIYNPFRTKLIMDAQSRGLITENGLWMLVAQAKKSAELFVNSKIGEEKIAEIHNILCNQMENIILIGMPGCGKTTIGKLLAEALCRPFLDMDAEIENSVGMTIPEIFAKYGETYFRKLETEILDKYGKESGLVIATGGGCVTRQENYPSLHQNGRIYLLKRDVQFLPTAGRPLSQSNNLEDLYKIRKPLYESFSDFQIDNNCPIPQTVADILLKERLK